MIPASVLCDLVLFKWKSTESLLFDQSVIFSAWVHIRLAFFGGSLLLITNLFFTSHFDFLIVAHLYPLEKPPFVALTLEISIMVLHIRLKFYLVKSCKTPTSHRQSSMGIHLRSWRKAFTQNLTIHRDPDEVIMAPEISSVICC